MRGDERRILVVKLADLGDLLVCEPAIRSLRSAFPRATIDLLTPPSSSSLVPLIGHGLRVVEFPKHLFDHPSALIRPDRLLAATRLATRLRRARYDTVVLLHHLTTPAGAMKFRLLTRAVGAREVVGLDNGRGTFLTRRVQDLGFGASHEAAYMLTVAQAAGGRTVKPAPQIDRTLLQPAAALPPDYAVIYPATGPYSPARTWEAGRYGQIAAMLATRGITPVVVGARDAADAAKVIEHAESSTVSLVEQTTLPELASVVDGARLVVGGDSFVGHLAAALGRPAITIFGPSNRDAWRPWGSIDLDAVACRSDARRGVVVYHDLPCQPCLYTGFRLGRPAGCPTRTCLALTTVEDVVRAIDASIGAS